MSSTEKQTESLDDEVQELVWALVDDHATDEQVRRLEQMLLNSGEAREIYIKCMKLHADLHTFFRAENEGAAKPIAPIIDSLPPIGTTITPPTQNQRP